MEGIDGKITMDSLSNVTHQQSYIDQFHQDGVLVFKSLFSNQQLQLIFDEVQRVRQIIMPQVALMKRPLKTHSDIAERQLGRFDYRCGFTAPIFNQIAQPVVTIVKALSPTIDFRFYWGAIPSLSGSGPTDMHRDVYPILNTMAGNDLDQLDISIPPYYFTVLIPLITITPENGPTQFIKGSHKRPIVDDTREKIYAPLLSPGDMVIFDGRTLHRGSANNSDQERLVAYITFVANWYHDQTFIINEYLFPDLSMPGR